ncbi:GD17867 [Drosophila simulans]|uniref:GD17867 n=1 Tax=Drosophila simulans TaxID=7240 RepID=B4NUU7_DROSI|nr:GD17867 [Drosophila simulans]
MAHMCRGKFTKASRVMDMVSRSKHKFAPIHEAILRKMLKLMIDPNYGKKRSRPSIETDNQPNLEEIGIARMEKTPQTLYKVSSSRNSAFASNSTGLINPSRRKCVRSTNTFKWSNRDRPKRSPLVCSPSMR